MRKFLFLSLAFGLISTQVHADLINVDFDNNNNDTPMSGAAATGAAGDQWNVAPVFNNWLNTESNGNIGNTPPLSLVQLNDSTGALSGVSYSMEFLIGGAAPTDGSGGGRFTAAVPDSEVATDAEALMRSYVFAGQSNASIRLSLEGLTADTEYNLYLYGAGNAPGQGSIFTLNGDSLTTAAESSNALLTEGEDYVVFNLVTDTSTSLTVDIASNGQTTFLNFNGFQLESVNAVPEPGSATLISLVVGCTLLCRRKNH